MESKGLNIASQLTDDKKSWSDLCIHYKAQWKEWFSTSSKDLRSNNTPFSIFYILDEVFYSGIYKQPLNSNIVCPFYVVYCLIPHISTPAVKCNPAFPTPSLFSVHVSGSYFRLSPAGLFWLYFCDIQVRYPMIKLHILLLIFMHINCSQWDCISECYST